MRRKLFSLFFTQELLRDAGSDWKEVWLSVQEMEEEEVEEEELVEMERARCVAARAHRKATREILRRGRQFGEEAETKEEGLLFKQVRSASPLS